METKMPSFWYIDMHNVTTTMPMISTSSIASFRSVVARATSAPVLRPQLWRTAAATNTTMSSKVKETTKPASMIKAMKLLISPCWIQETSVPSATSRLTSAFAFSGTSRFTRTGSMGMPMISVGSGPFGAKRSCNCRRSDITGIVTPTQKAAAKATLSTTVSSRMRSASRHLGRRRQRPKPEASSPERMPRDATVEPTQKMLKQVKPRSSRMSACNILGWFRPLTRYVSKM
mmetsp:Transcript_38190/g.109628  ORF Transcript_38190/g.109628 Transcript_38190/m.109628 type:complete len:231 (+) Transcript_38190:305-997(+)